jgi:hypothetical protein
VLAAGLALQGWPCCSATNVVSCNLPAGPNTMSVVYKSSASTTNYLHLDNLVVGDDAQEHLTKNVHSLPQKSIAFVLQVC